ncbi:MAG: Holliday junction branch migration protein RuvA [Pseudomonadota bacterium]
MIGLIRGRIFSKAADHVVIDTGGETGGVGYVIHCAERTLAALPAEGGAAALFTDLVVREDLLQLLGFPSLEEREFHRMVTSVQGVGARLGLAISGHLDPERAARALALGDAAALRAVPGVGPKLAARIVAELKDKAPLLMVAGRNPGQTAMGSAPAAPPPEPAPSAAPAARMAAQAPSTASVAPAAASDALSALTNLGYPAGEAAAAIATVSDAASGAGETGEAGAMGAPALIRAALRHLAPKP